MGNRACEVLKRIGFSDFTVRVNNRKLINSFLDSLKTKIGEVMRTMDKMEKIGESGVREELKSKNIDDEVIDKILKFVKIKNLSEASHLIKDEKAKRGFANWMSS